jgi:Acetoacetate decarboxylase (ADC)
MTRAKSARFFRVLRTSHATSAGPVDLPILYFDTTMVGAFFDAPLAGAEALLAGTGLVPAPLRKDRATWALVFFDYRDTSVGAYHEVGLAIFVLREGERRPAFGLLDMLRSPRTRSIGSYVVDLPVSTEIANAAGRELWGYPKFVTDLPFRLRGRHFEGVVRDPEGKTEIVRLEGELGRGLPAPPFSLMTYTRLRGELLRTPIDVRGTTHVHQPGSVQIEIGSSTHPMAERLQQLCSSGTQPSFVAVTDQFQSKLHAGTAVRA